MILSYFIGIILHCIVFYLWKHRYVMNYGEVKYHRIRIPILLLGVIILGALIPIVNIIIALGIYLPLILSGGVDANHTKWENLPTWFNKTIE